MPDAITQMMFGTATVGSLTTNISGGDFSALAASFVNTDADVPMAAYAQATLAAPDWNAAPSANGLVELWGVLKDVDGTLDDTDPPSGTSVNGARFFGAWRIVAADALQRRTIVICIEGMNAIDFYLRNMSGAQMVNNGGTACQLNIRPFAYGGGAYSLSPPTFVSVSLGGSRAASLPLAAATHDLVNAEPAFTVPSNLSTAMLLSARIVADVRSMDASVSITPRLVNASTLAVAGAGVACTASADDYSGVNQHQTVLVTLVAGQTYKAQAVVSSAAFATFMTARLEIG